MKKFRLLTLLALLMTVATGAWADEQSESFTAATDDQTTYTGEHFTITGQYADEAGLFITGQNPDLGGAANTVTISSKNGENITRIEAVIGYKTSGWGAVASTSGNVTGTYANGQTITISSVNATTVTLSSTTNDSEILQFISWTIYYEPAAASTTFTVDVKFEANGNSKTIENVTLPYTFWCDWNNENGELDGIIKELYGLSGGYCDPNQTPSASGNSNVTAGKDGKNQYITISAPFKGTATVTGTYRYSNGATMNYELTISIPAATYTVDLKANTDDASNWTGKAGTATEFSALPLEDLSPGDAVTLKYGGNRKVKTVTATTDAGGSPAPAGLTLDLATVTEATTVEDGYTVTGTLGAKVKISIAEGATVTLDGVTINGVDNNSYKWAGITCLGDATIILSGTNTVKGFHHNYPGIYVPQNNTVTIQGSGSLTASSNGWGCGIGGGYQIACGNIVIAGGTITAAGGTYSAGIGGGYQVSCGNISITGGTINATGGMCGAGIGTGYKGQCGTVTITDGVTSVTATKGEDANHSIGAGQNGNCGTVTIGCSLDSNGNIISGTGSTDPITTSPYTYQPSN